MKKGMVINLTTERRRRPIQALRSALIEVQALAAIGRANQKVHGLLVADAIEHAARVTGMTLAEVRRRACR